MTSTWCIAGDIGGEKRLQMECCVPSPNNKSPLCSKHCTRGRWTIIRATCLGSTDTSMQNSAYALRFESMCYVCMYFCSYKKSIGCGRWFALRNAQRIDYEQHPPTRKHNTQEADKEPAVHLAEVPKARRSERAPKPKTKRGEDYYPEVLVIETSWLKGVTAIFN